MLVPIVIGIAPIVAFGLTAMWLDAKATNLQLLDLTGQAPTSKRHDRGKAKIDAVVLHQTGFSRGLDPSRYLKVTAHFVILENGRVLQLHPVTAKLWASDGFNSRSVAVEFVGNFRSTTGKWWKPEKYGAHQPTSAQIDAGRRLLLTLERAGVRYVFAHRQSSSSRGNDPGPEIWEGVGEWGVRKLGMSDGGPGFVQGGAAIPDAWREATKLT